MWPLACIREARSPHATAKQAMAVTKVEQSIVEKGKEWQQKARLLYEVWVALKLGPETPGGPWLSLIYPSLN